MGLLPRPRADRGFAAIYNIAAARKGPDELEAMMPEPSPPAALRKLRDDRVLSAMAQSIFSAGFVWRVVENKWPGFEAAFSKFSVRRVAGMSPGDIDELATDTRIVRNRQKIVAVRDNARLLSEIAAEHKSFGAFIADWPDDDTIGLWRQLSKRGSRLGGFTGPYVLRRLGKDTFMLTGDVVKALIREGVVDKAPTSQRDLAATQDAFNRWRVETGRPHSQLSRILACSVD